jgi:hypothetical protein
MHAVYTIHGTIKGLAPLLFNRFTEAAQQALDTRQTGGRLSVPQKIAEAEEKVHRGINGNLIIPAWSFKQSLVAGCSAAGLKHGRSGLGQHLKAIVFADGEIDLGVKERDFMHEHWGRIPPGPKGAGAIIRRPALNPGWEGRFRLVVTDDRQSPEQIRQALDETGLLVGLGGWRPEYGRFMVTEWTVEKPAAA